MNRLDKLAQKITKKSSLQTYYTIKLLADRRLRFDAYKAYAYFRWLDNMVDDNLKTPHERQKFVKTQKRLIDLTYKGLESRKTLVEEEMVTELIKNNRKGNPLLESYIRNFFAIIEFDARRRGKLVARKELEWYSTTIGKAVTDCIEHFIGHSSAGNRSIHKYKAATAAHIVHALRDFKDDLKDGYINIPKEDIKRLKIDIDNPEGKAINEWVEAKVKVAEKLFDEGRKYINRIPIMKRKMAALLYCFRFKPVLTAIKRDNYRLREKY